MYTNPVAKLVHSGCMCACFLEQCELRCALGKKKLSIYFLSGMDHARTWPLAWYACYMLHCETFKLTYSKIPWELVKYFYIGRSGMKRRFGIVFTDFAQFQYFSMKNADLCLIMPDSCPFGACTNALISFHFEKNQRQILMRLGF